MCLWGFATSADLDRPARQHISDKGLHCLLVSQEALYMPKVCSVYLIELYVWLCRMISIYQCEKNNKVKHSRDAVLKSSQVFRVKQPA